MVNVSTHFRPPWWLRNRHAQTLWAQLVRKPPTVAIQRERIALPDADFVDIDWAGAKQLEPRTIGLVLPGLGGDVTSHYARGLLNVLSGTSWQVGLLNFRGGSGEPNHFAHSYHAGAYGDLLHVLRTLRKRHPQTRCFAIGVSLGGSVLLNGLGRHREFKQLLQAAVAISVPYILSDAARALDRGFARIYQRHLLAQQRELLLAKFARRPVPKFLRLERLTSARNFFQFDDWFTAPLHDFKGVEDYYQRCSAKQYLAHIETPTLLLHALDDPFMFETTPPQRNELAPCVDLEVTPHGGHVGFISGTWPWRLHSWMETQVLNYLQSKLS